MPTVRKATRADVPAMATALADAFDDDPVMGWMLGPKPKQKRLHRFFSVALRSWFLRHEQTWTADVDGAGALAGAGVWAPPGRWRLGFLDMLTTAPTMMRLAGRRVGSLTAGQRMLEQHHLRRPHYYLAILGTDPQKQGKGFASAMIAPVLARCDEEAMPAYLESSKQSNIGFYERHGFVLNEELQLPDGPPIWPMLREPRI
jgi:GNAT superfamily N-acetyltransferase